MNSAEDLDKLKDKYQEVMGDVRAFGNQINETTAFFDLIKEHKSEKTCPLCSNKVSDWGERLELLKKKIEELEKERDYKITESTILSEEYDEWKEKNAIKDGGDVFGRKNY